MSIPQKLTGSIMTNPLTMELFLLPYTYMTNTTYNVCSHVQYCRAAQFFMNEVYTSGDDIRRPLADTIHEVINKHLKDVKRNKKLKEFNNTAAREFILPTYTAKITPTNLVCAGVKLGKYIKPTTDKEVNKLLGFLCDLRDQNIYTGWTNNGIKYISPQTTIILSYMTEPEALMSVLSNMFPVWTSKQNEEELLNFLKELSPLKINIV